MTENRISFTLNNVVAILNSHADAILRARYDLTFSQFVFLVALRDGPLNQSELAACTNVSAAAISKRVNWFVERDFITANPDPGNGRVVVLSLTRTGKKLVDSASSVLEKRLLDVFEDVPQINFEKLNLQLNRIYDHLTQVPFESRTDRRHK